MTYTFWQPTPHPLISQGIKKKRIVTGAFKLETTGEEKDGNKNFEKE